MLQPVSPLLLLLLLLLLLQLLLLTKGAAEHLVYLCGAPQQQLSLQPGPAANKSCCSVEAAARRVA